MRSFATCRCGTRAVTRSVVRVALRSRQKTGCIRERELPLRALPPTRALAAVSGLARVSAPTSGTFANRAEVQVFYSEIGGVFGAEVTALRVTFYANQTWTGPVLLI
jgi:hypothetical protein